MLSTPALRYGDQTAADKAIETMAALGMKKGDLVGSIKSAAPLSPIAKKDRKAFVNQLTHQEYATFQRAQLWYQESFLGQ